MHILIIHQAFASLDEPGGTRHHEFARLLAARGHRVTVIASSVSYLTGAPSISAHSQKEWAEMEGAVRVLRASVHQAHHRSFLHRLLAFLSFMFSSFWVGLRVKNVDLVWGTSPPIFQGLTAWMLAKLKRVPCLFEVRDLWPQFAIAVGLLRNPILIQLSEWLERFLYANADRLLVNSPGFIDHVKAKGARQVELIPNGADASMFDPRNEGLEFRQAHQLEDKFVVLYAGAHGMSNDLGVVLECAALLAHKLDIHFVLVGDGKEKSVLQARAAQMKLENLSFLAPVSKTDMPGVLAGADACIAILRPLEEYKRTYPNKVFDYMAAGRPVALAIDGVIREVVDNAGCGYFAQPGDPQALADAITRLAQDTIKARQMGLNGRTYLEEHFSREKVAAQLISLLEEMDVKGNPGNGRQQQ
jgi:glycosyltransferase involved in cell wall biosynthesis